MIRTAKEIEREHVARFKEQQREALLRKFMNPWLEDPKLSDVWVVFTWHPVGDDVAQGEWKLAGFRPRKRRRKPQSMGRFFARVRRGLSIDKATPVRVTDLRMARQFLANPNEQGWLKKPPRYQTRKAKMVQRMPEPLTAKQPKRRAKQKAYLLNKRNTKYIAIGRSGVWQHRDPRYLYLGPLRSMQKRQAQFEARRMFNVYSDILVLDISELSKPLRDAMARGKRVQAGVTRIQWPEVPPTFEEMWPKVLRRLLQKEFHGTISADDMRLITIELALRAEWEAQGSPWLTLSWFRKQIKPWRPDACLKSKSKKQKTRSANAGPSKRKSKHSVPKRKRNLHAPKRTRSTSIPQKLARVQKRSEPQRSLRSTNYRVQYAIVSVRAIKTKGGAIRRGSHKEQTSMRSVLVVKARLKDSKATRIRPLSRRTKTNVSRKKSVRGSKRHFQPRQSRQRTRTRR
jgi:hypothetical protein